MTSRKHFWNNIFAVAYKEASVVRHDRAFVATVFAQPLMIFMLFGFALSNKPANVPWALLDRDHSPASRRVLQDVQATHYFLEPQLVSSYREGHALLKTGHALALVVIPSGFRRSRERGHAQLQILLDGSDPLSAARVGAYIAMVVRATSAGEIAPATHFADSVIEASGPIDVRQQFWFNGTLRDRNFFLAVFAGMLLTNICLSSMSLGLVAERESGTYEHMLAQPTRPIEIILGKLLPYVAISYGMLVFATCLPGVVFGFWPNGSLFALALVTLPFVLASLGVGVLVSTYAETSAQAVFLTVFFILPSFVLSGSMLPYQLMPHGVREIGALFPLRWYQIALRGIFERGAGVAEIAVPLLVLTAMFAAILIVTGRRMPSRLG